MLALLPTEIIIAIIENLSFKDLARMERSCRSFQSLILWEIDRRIKKIKYDDWRIVVHLGHTKAVPIRFDPETKKIFYAITMQPIHISAMFDHGRRIHCSIFREGLRSKHCTQDGFVITVEEGMIQGKTVEMDVKGKSCEIHAALTREKNHQQQQLRSLAPSICSYTVQVTELRLPLSTMAT
ncbi:hypothetical protein DFQ30_008812 [Apophysomyces sp. BC1015]|nr:hypothetical protein DFQ30_008812 [Apophysomyces sp. BC1015]